MLCHFDCSIESKCGLIESRIEMKKLAKEQKAKKSCPCKRTACERHGDCEACRDFHKKSGKYPVACDQIK